MKSIYINLEEHIGGWTIEWNVSTRQIGDVEGYVPSKHMVLGKDSDVMGNVSGLVNMLENLAKRMEDDKKNG